MPTTTQPTSLAATLAAYTPPPAPVSGFMRFFWWCAGANQAFLEKSPTDHIKYGNIGATVVMTSFMACISMTYALHAVFEATWIAVVMGLIWAGVIFLIDRSIVTSMRKPSREAKFWSFETWGEIPFVLVRFAVAIVIAFTISKPLEVKIFENRIAAQIDEEKLAKEMKAATDIESVNGVGQRKAELEQSNQELKQLVESANEEPPRNDYQELKAKRTEQVNAYNRAQAVNGGKISSNASKIARINRTQRKPVKDENGTILRYDLTPAARRNIGALSAQNRAMQGEINSKRDAVARTDNSLDKIRAEYQQDLLKRRGQAEQDKARSRKAVLAADSSANVRKQKSEAVRKRSYETLENGTYPLMTQVSALGTLTAKDKALGYASILITLLFLAIETAPLLVKLFSKRGPYDDELELAEHLAWVRMQYDKSDINSKINRKLDLINQTDERVKRTVEARQNSMFETSNKGLEKKQELELANNEHLLRLIAEKQLSLADELVKQWYEKEREKLSQAETNAAITPSPLVNPTTVAVPLVPQQSLSAAPASAGTTTT